MNKFNLLFIGLAATCAEWTATGQPGTAVSFDFATIRSGSVLLPNAGGPDIFTVKMSGQ